MQLSLLGPNACDDETQQVEPPRGGSLALFHYPWVEISPAPLSGEDSVPQIVRPPL
jgi:hypothetical protein